MSYNYTEKVRDSKKERKLGKTRNLSDEYSADKQRLPQQILEELSRVAKIINGKQILRVRGN